MAENFWVTNVFKNSVKWKAVCVIFKKCQKCSCANCYKQIQFNVGMQFKMMEPFLFHVSHLLGKQSGFLPLWQGYIWYSRRSENVRKETKEWGEIQFKIDSNKIFNSLFFFFFFTSFAFQKEVKNFKMYELGFHIFSLQPDKLSIFLLSFFVFPFFCWLLILSSRFNQRLKGG